MTLDELIFQLTHIRDNGGFPGDAKVKIYHRESSSMEDMITDANKIDARKVQVYLTETEEYRNKYILIESENNNVNG